MKRIIGILTGILLAIGNTVAQNNATGPDSTSIGERVALKVGLSAGATLYGNGNNFSPYYSKYGFTIQIPILWEYDFAPHWQLSTGLRYDFNWDPLANAVEEVWVNNGEENGLAHNTTPTLGKQTAYIHSGFIGIPMKITWFPKADDKRLLGIGLDYYVGYAVKNIYQISTTEIRLTDAATQSYNASGDMTEGGSPTLLPWRMELGLTLSTDYLGLVHGARFFFDLLPRYKDPLTNEKIRTVGITLFL